MQAYEPTVGKRAVWTFVADMGRGFWFTSHIFVGVELCETGYAVQVFVGENARACVREKRTFARGWGRNVERKRMQNNRRGRMPRKKNFFIMAVRLKKCIFSEFYQLRLYHYMA